MPAARRGHAASTIPFRNLESLAGLDRIVCTLARIGVGPDGLGWLVDLRLVPLPALPGRGELWSFDVPERWPLAGYSIWSQNDFPMMHANYTSGYGVLILPIVAGVMWADRRHRAWRTFWMFGVVMAVGIVATGGSLVGLPALLCGAWLALVPNKIGRFPMGRAASVENNGGLGRRRLCRGIRDANFAKVDSGAAVKELFGCRPARLRGGRSEHFQRISLRRDWSGKGSSKLRGVSRLTR